MSSAEQMVFITAASNRSNYRVYHTDRDCPRLSQARDVKEKPLSVLFDDVTECEYCGVGGSDV